MGHRFLGILLLIIVSVLLGLFFDETAALIFLSSMLLIMVAYHIVSLATLDRWLQRYDPASSAMAPVPNNFGAWGDVFVRLTRYMRRYYRNRQSLSRALERLQRATSAMPDGIVILDKIDRIEWCNPVAEQHLGLDLKMDIGQHITHLVRQVQFVEYLSSGDFSKPVIIKQSRYQAIMLSLQLVPYGDEEKLLISRDITRFEKMEIMRRDFIANVSHELRTPLTVVNGFLEMLQDNGVKDSDMEKHALGLMSQQSRRMQRLVEDLLTLSRLENGQNILREEEVDMKELLLNLLHEAQSLSAKRHTITLQLKEDNMNVLGSGDELRSALGNLVSNAVRYTPNGGDIVLSWGEEKGLFYVRDSGIGIEPQHIPRLTERFYRIDRSRSRETGGTGLGLAIVKHILNRHQARMDIISELGKGSTFKVWFPLKRLQSTIQNKVPDVQLEQGQSMPPQQ
ncbi:MAG: phosphate regulon sensor histidine kinase PhoR [Nitrosomonas sp.]|nr:phosphate regulon sensor histidine kinase PhoR [Nitrosomonas sp.]MBK7364731.1 phosphate regulon sensor histidine kinase PhoR [Nitrosomonas sp.]